MAEIRKKHAQPTRERILDAALDLFGSGGVDATSLDDIARAVGVAKQTVLYWFVTKEELAVAVMQRVADELVLEIGAAIRSAPHGFARIQATVTAVFRPAIRRPAEPAPGKGGHLVLVFGAEDGALRLHNPSGHDAASQCDARVALTDFARFFAGRGIWLPGS